MARSGKLYLYTPEESKLIELLLAASKISSLETKDNCQYITFSFPEFSREGYVFSSHCYRFYDVEFKETNSSLHKDYVATAPVLSRIVQDPKSLTFRFLSETEITDIAAKLKVALTTNDPKAIMAIPNLNAIDQARIFHCDPTLLDRALKMDDPSCLLKLTCLFHRAFLAESSKRNVSDSKEESNEAIRQEVSSSYFDPRFHLLEKMSDKELVKFLFSMRHRLAENYELNSNILFHIVEKRPFEIYLAFYNAITGRRGLITCYDSYRGSPLHLAAARSSQNYFEDFIDAHSANELSDVTGTITYIHETVLSIALKAKQQPDTIAKLLLKVSDSAVETVLGNNLDDELCRSFVSTFTSTFSWQTSAFTAKVLPHLTNELKRALISNLKFSATEVPATLKSFLFATLSRNSPNRWGERDNVFESFYTFSTRTQILFSEFVRYLSLEANRVQTQAIHYEPDTLNALLLTQTPEPIAELLKLLTPEQQRELNILPLTNNCIINYLLTQPSWQEVNVIDIILSLAQKEVAHELLQRHSEGKRLPLMLKQKLMGLQLPDDEADRISWLSLFDEKEHPNEQLISQPSNTSPESKEEFITTSKGTKVALTDTNFADLLWEEGIASATDYQRLMSNTHLTLLPYQRLRELKETKKIFSGVKIPYKIYHDLHSGDGLNFKTLVEELSESNFKDFVSLLSTLRSSGHCDLSRVNATTGLSGYESAATFLSHDQFHELYLTFHDEVYRFSIIYRTRIIALFNLILKHQSAKTIRFIISAQGFQLSTVGADQLQIAAQYQPAEILLTMLQGDENPETRYDKFVTTRPAGRHLLHIAAEHQSPEGFELIIDQTNSATLSDACMFSTNNNDSVLNIAFNHQPLRLIAKLLNKISLEARRFLLENRAENVFIRLKLYDYQLSEPSLGTTIHTLLIDPERIKKHWMDGNTLSAEILASLMTEVSDASLTGNPVNNLLLAEMHNPFRGLRAPPAFRRPPLFNLADPNLIVTVWHEGFTHIEQYRHLRQHQKTVSGLTSTLDRLTQANALFTGFYQSMPQPTQGTATLSLEAINQCILDRNAIVQLIHPSAWQSNLEKMAGFEIRDEEKTATHYFDHHTKKVLPIKDRDTRPPLFAVKYLGATFDTFLLDNDEKEINTVGLLYDLHECKSSGLQLKNASVRAHEWSGTEAAVTTYANKIKQEHIEDIEEFKTFVQQNRFCPQQMWVELTGSAARCILIADDSPPSRRTARRYANEMRMNFNLDLPIVFFDSVAKSTHLYLPEMIAQDELAERRGAHLNPLSEQDAKFRVEGLVADFREKPEWITHATFWGTRTERTPVTSAQEILDVVDTTRLLTTPFWRAAQQTVLRKLDTAIKNKAGNDTAETIAFYQAERRKFFNRY